MAGKKQATPAQRRHPPGSREHPPHHHQPPAAAAKKKEDKMETPGGTQQRRSRRWLLLVLMTLSLCFCFSVGAMTPNSDRSAITDILTVLRASSRQLVSKFHDLEKRYMTRKQECMQTENTNGVISFLDGGGPVYEIVDVQPW